MAASAPEVRFVKRKILALYDGARFNDNRDTFIHKFAEMPLNHIGYDVRFHDVRTGFPKLSNLADYRGVLTWFVGPINNGEDYLRWADKAAISGLKFLVMNDIGVKVNTRTKPLINRFLAHIGIVLKSRFVSETSGTKIIDFDEGIIGFERPLYNVIPPYSVFVASRSDIEIHLSLRPPSLARKPSEGQGPSGKKIATKAVMVASSSGGGFVNWGFASHYDAELERDKWMINPFAYFRKVFGNELFPIPDVTTLSGRRIYFSHVDGDGWNNVSLIEHYRSTATLSSKVMLKELIEPYDDLPVTVGLVSGDLDASIGGNPDATHIARKIFALDHVEVGSHSHTHPFDWAFYKNYSRQQELEMVEKSARKNSGNQFGLINTLRNLIKKKTPRERNKKYIAGSDDLPRAYLKKPFAIGVDVTGSIALAESYAPKGKQARLLLWSGDTNPFEKAIRATREAGVYNMNGGDSRFDVEFPSIAYLSPLSRLVGSERQIYAAASNENTYTNDWTGPFYAFANLVKTLENTEKPRRLKPFNLYYHTYSAERDGSLKAVKLHLNRARAGAYTPIPASEYAAIANSFFKVEIKRLSANLWSVHNRHDVQTLRFDHAQKLRIDWQKSRGIIGASRHEGSLYLALDAAQTSPLIAVKEALTDELLPAELPSPVLHDSRWQIDRVKTDKKGLSFRAKGFGDGKMLWLGLHIGDYTIAVSRNQKQIWQGNNKVTKSGRLALKIPVRALEPVQIEIRRAPRMTSKAVGEGG